RDALLSLRSAPLLSGFRGRPAVCMEALVAARRAVAAVAGGHAGRVRARGGRGGAAAAGAHAGERLIRRRPPPG
ncbi:hypothetical protein I5F76_33850, partial [Pseudomonas aeruginosa]|nr:hypothetical protein [Pseudomonas aeruginosa]